MPPRTGIWNDDAAPKAAWWNAAARWTGKDMLTALAYHVFGDSTPSTGDARVLDGLLCTAGSGMQTDYQAGAALHYDASVYTAVIDGDETVAPWGLQIAETAGSLTHSANASGSTRVDLICISSTVDTDRSKSVQQKSPSGSPTTTSQDTRWGHVSTVAIVEGTAGAGAPATPTGSTKLCEVSIPSGAGSAASFTYTNKIYAAQNSAIGPGHALPWTVFSTGSTGVEGHLFHYVQDGSNPWLMPSWDKSNHWPVWQRNGVPSGDTSDNLYAMTVPGGRSWPRTVSFADGNGTVTGSDLSATPTGGGITITRAGTGSSENATMFKGIPCDARGLEVTDLEFVWDCQVAFDGTINTASVNFLKVSESATTTLGTQAITISSTAGRTVTAVSFTDFTLAEGDSIVCQVTVDLGSDGSTGTMRLFSCTAHLTEGRA